MDDVPSSTTGLIAPDLLEQVEALAAVEHRSSRDIMRDAIAGYLKDRASLNTQAQLRSDAARLAAQQAGARIRERRQYRPMPEGMTIREMTDYGRS